MKTLRNATILMAATAMAITAFLVVWTFGPMTARAFDDHVGELAVAYNNAQLERDFEKVYPQYRSRLPIQLDDRTTLVDLTYRGHVFRQMHHLSIYHY